MIDSFSGADRWLSNFHASQVWLDGRGYMTVEHAYQAAKTLDATERDTIRKAQSPGLAKKLGRTITLRPDWDDVRLCVMVDLVRQKFDHPVFRKCLLATGDLPIVEGNTWGDRFWGVSGGVGENHLGRIIMRVRDELRSANDTITPTWPLILLAVA